MNRVRLGFVGVGTMGQCAHLANYATLPECEVVAISEIRPELARLVAARYGVPKTYPNHEAMLAHERLDGIVAAQPFTRHGQLLPSLLEARIPLLTEKPLASSVSVGERLVEALSTSGTWHMLGYHKRADPATAYAVAQIRSLKASNRLGALKYVRVTMPAGDWIAGGFSGLIRTDEPAPSLPTDPAAADMSADTFREYVSFVNYYIHQVNLLRHLLGEPYKLTFADKSGVLVAAESTSGVTATLEMTPYQTTLDWNETALVAFERGYVKLTLPAPLASARPGSVEVFSDGEGDSSPTLARPTLPWVGAMRAQAQHFVAAVRGEVEPLTGAVEALEDLRIARDYVRLRWGV